MRNTSQTGQERKQRRTETPLEILEQLVKQKSNSKDIIVPLNLIERVIQTSKEYAKKLSDLQEPSMIHVGGNLGKARNVGYWHQM